MPLPSRSARNSSPSIPATPKMQRGGKAARPKAKEPDYIELDDEDLDELMMNIPCSSPFFTQPTQVVKRGTQPTQVVGRTTQPTQILDRTTQPTQIIGRATLRPPSSPIAPSSPSNTVEVPASSPFQPRSEAKVSPSVGTQRGVANRLGSLMAPAGTSFRPPVARPVAKMKTYLTLSDDELSEDYKHRDSSGDESPMRGDIKPSSFLKNAAPLESIETKPSWKANRDIELRDIHDVRLRHLTKEVHKIVSKSKPSITIKACRDALTSGVGWQVAKAVKLLTGSALSKTPSQPKQQTLLKSFNSSIDNSNSTNSLSQKSTQKDCSLTSNSTSTPYSSVESSFNKSNPLPPRRRLVQGRKNRSPTPPPVFSVSSSASSAPTTPARSEHQFSSKESTMAAVASPIRPEPVTQPRRRLQRGRRNRSPPAAVITLDSDSDSEFDLKLTPANKTVSRKRKAQSPVEPEPVDVPSESDLEQTTVTPTVQQSPRHEQVLNYLNSCTAESLAQMTGFSAADSKLIISSRPFASVLDAERVSKKETKSKTKAKRVQIGSLFVEKLTSWFEAFHAASEVIKQCEDRGAKLQKAMANWPMDKNGKIQKDGTLPISEKPRLMADGVTLKSYQLLGLNWMNMLHSKHFSGILADDMGLGKTCQVISIIAHLVGTYDEDSGKTRPWPFLVVVPPSVCENWMAEFERFAPELSVCPYLGKDRRNMDPEEARNNHVILTSYSQVERAKEDLRWLQELEPYAAIFDEGHKLKNRKNLIYKQMMRVPTEWRLILSGTPVQNNLKELLTLLHFVEPELFGAEIFESLDIIFEAKVPSKEIHNFAALAKERVSNARAIMAPFILQRRKEEVLDLAKKTEHNIVVEMHPKQKAIYDEIKGRYLVPMKQRGSSVAHPWMQLRKAAIHHQLFRVHFTDKIVKEMIDILWDRCSEEELYVQSKADRHKALLLQNYMEKSDFQLHLECKHFKKYIGHFDIPHRSWEEGPKVQKLLELVRGYIENGDRVLVFSRFDLVIDILRETLAFANIQYCELTGSTDISDRFPEIERFNANPDIPVFLLTTGAGGTGLNLTAANKIIIFDQSDNPQDDVQASNRAHRIGQTRDVEVIRLLTRDSVERLIFNSCVKKLMLARIVEGNIPVDDDAESESVEQQCRKLMLLEEENAAQAASQEA